MPLAKSAKDAMKKQSRLGALCGLGGRNFCQYEFAKNYR